MLGDILYNLLRCRQQGAVEKPWCEDSYGKLVPSTAVLCCWVDNLSRCPISFRKHYERLPTIVFPEKDIRGTEILVVFSFKTAIIFLSLVYTNEVETSFDETKSHGTKVTDQHKYVKKNATRHGSAKVLSRSEVSSIFDQLHSPLA